MGVLSRIIQGPEPKPPPPVRFGDPDSALGSRKPSKPGK